MPSSYFSDRESTLDPDLFAGDRMHPAVRDELLSMVYGSLHSKFRSPERWARPYVTGSGASYQWSAQRDPADLDVLVAVDDIVFRRKNPDMSGLSSRDISSAINDVFHEELMPHTKDWKGYETTFYALDTPDIKNLNPYAAYSLVDESWEVRPRRDQVSIPDEWEDSARSLHSQARTIVQWYSKALTTVQSAQNDAHRRNSEQYLMFVLDQADELYRSLHTARSAAFSTSGEGYGDRNNFLWQAAKRDGWLPAVKELHLYRKQLRENNDISTYGVEMPDSDTLVRRAALSYTNLAAQ